MVYPGLPSWTTPSALQALLSLYLLSEKTRATPCLHLSHALHLPWSPAATSGAVFSRLLRQAFVLCAEAAPASLSNKLTAPKPSKGTVQMDAATGKVIGILPYSVRRVMCCIPCTLHGKALSRREGSHVGASLQSALPTPRLLAPDCWTEPCHVVATGEPEGASSSEGIPFGWWWLLGARAWLFFCALMLWLLATGDEALLLLLLLLLPELLHWA